MKIQTEIIDKYKDELCYEGAMKKGCDACFLNCFSESMLNDPLCMTKSFLLLKENEKEDVQIQLKNLMQWNDWIRIVVEKNPHLQGHEERVKAMQLLNIKGIGKPCFYKNHRSDRIWWVDTFIPRIGVFEFTFDKKKIFNLFTDYPYQLTKEDREVFDQENPILG